MANSLSKGACRGVEEEAGELGSFGAGSKQDLMRESDLPFSAASLAPVQRLN